MLSVAYGIYRSFIFSFCERKNGVSKQCVYLYHRLEEENDNPNNGNNYYMRLYRNDLYQPYTRSDKINIFKIGKRKKF